LGAGAAQGAAESTRLEPDQGNTCERKAKAFLVHHSHP